MKEIFIRKNLLTWGSRVGKNLQFMAKTFVASFIGVPGKLAASQMSRLVSEQANLQSAAWMGSVLSRSK